MMRSEGILSGYIIPKIKLSILSVKMVFIEMESRRLLKKLSRELAEDDIILVEKETGKIIK